MIHWKVMAEFGRNVLRIDGDDLDFQTFSSYGNFWTKRSWTNGPKKKRNVFCRGRSVLKEQKEKFK